MAMDDCNRQIRGANFVATSSAISLSPFCGDNGMAMGKRYTRCNGKEALIAILLIFFCIHCCPIHGQQRLSAKNILLDGADWRMGSFAIGDGEKAGAYSLNFNDAGFRDVVVPGDTQLQAGFTGAKGFRETKDLIAVNEKEWWYRKEFHMNARDSRSISRIVFDGSDYFTTVWLNGHLLGTHEGTYTPFSFNVTELLNYGGKNLLAVKVTHPWAPRGRALAEYMNGDFSMSNFGDDMPLKKPPYFVDVSWDALPAQGNAAFAMGIWRSVHLVESSPVYIGDLNVETESIGKDGSAILKVSATVDNETSEICDRTIRLQLKPDNFSGPAVSIASLKLKASPGRTTATEEVHLASARLWWTWDKGAQNLYDIHAGIAPENGFRGDRRSARFGIRTIARDKTMAYFLNGQRIFVKASWFPIENYYRSTPTYWDYDRDLRLFRDANFNLLVNFTVVEKPAFYNLCDELGILVVTELPFPQYGPQQVLDKGSPRKGPFLKQAGLQVSEIVTRLRNHPSIVEWAPLAEAHDKELGTWGYDGTRLDQEGYDTFIAQMRAAVARLSPDTIFHPSLCDLGEQHFWTGEAGARSDSGYYQGHFDAATGFVSEYGAVSMSSYENLGKYLTPKQQWDLAEPTTLRWFGLPIDPAAYAYWTSNMNDGLYSVLYYMEHFIDHNPRSARELVDDTQMYQAFLMKYATEAYRRKKYNPIMGLRSWDFLELAPGFRFGIVDYDRVPKIAYWYLKKAQSPVAVSFAYKNALESQFAGRAWATPVWVINDLSKDLHGSLHVEMRSLDGALVLAKDFPMVVNADSKAQAGIFSLDLPRTPGIYLLRAIFKAAELQQPIVEDSFVKAVAPAFSGRHRVLLIAQSKYAGPIRKLLQGMGLDVDVYDENSLDAMAGELRDGEAIHAKYDVIWLGCFESLAKILPPSTARALANAVRLSSGFIQTGGDGSFHGGDGHAAVVEATALGAVLPVTVENISDLIQGAYSMDDSMQSQPAIRKIGAAAADVHARDDVYASAELLRHYGLPGFNQVSVQADSRAAMTVAGEPLLVTGRYGDGKTVAFTGFTPAMDKNFELPMDEVLIAEPAARAWFSIFASLLRLAMPGDPVFNNNLLAAHEKPLFQTLKESPKTELALTMLSKGKLNGEEYCRIRIVNRLGYAHLVHLRADWSGTDAPPYLTEFSDNDFEMLPGETRDIDVDWRNKTAGAGEHGVLLVDAANASQAKLEF